MKIAYLISSCSSGGAELLVKRICQTISKINRDDIKIQVWVVVKIADCALADPQSALHFERTYVSDLEQHGVSVRYLNKRKNKDRFKCIGELKKLYRDFKPDIVHAHSELCAIYAALALRSEKCLLLETIHSSMITHKKLMRYFLAKHIDRFVSISDDVTRSMLASYIPVKKITLIQNGVDLENFFFPERTFSNSPMKLIAVGRLEKEKDYPFLIASYKAAIDKLRSVAADSSLPELHIVGAGSYQAELETLIKNDGFKDHVHLLGLRSDIPELLKESDVFTMSSSYEGLSLALIEAAAAGLPIIATDVGSNHKLASSGENGYLVQHGDTSSFAEAIIDLMTDTERRKAFSQKSVSMSESFDIKQTAKEHIELYDELCNKKQKKERCTAG